MPENRPLISVLCIVFNHQKYIRRCLESLLNQKTDFRYEIIIHDDASTDGTREIIKEYADKYPDMIIPILQEKNQYSSGTDIIKTYLFPKASGKYIVECEGDDFWCDENKLQLQAEALESHPNCVLCVHSTGTVDADGNKMDFRFPMMELNQGVIPSPDFIKMTLNENSWPFHLSSFMVTSGLFHEYMEFKAAGFPSKFYRVGDLPLYLYFGLHGDTYYIDREMSTYTMESGGFMSRVKNDPVFARRVHQGYVDGLTEFDKYTDYKYSDNVRRMLVTRRFEIARADRRFDVLISTPEFRPILSNRGVFKRAVIDAAGCIMLLAERVKGVFK